MISFSFDTSKVDIQKKLLTENTEWVWLKGHVCLYHEGVVMILEEVPVVGFFAHLYDKILKLTQQNTADFALISDDIHYNIYVYYREQKTLTIEANWGFSTGDLVISDIEGFQHELRAAIRQAHIINCTILPETKALILDKTLEEVLAPARA